MRGNFFRYLLLSSTALLLTAATFMGCASSVTNESMRLWPQNRRLQASLDANTQTQMPIRSQPFAAAANTSGQPASEAMRDAMPPTREELWVIEKPATRPNPNPNDPPIPGGGTLAVQKDSKFVPVPLKHTDVQASIAGYIATVDVKQQFHNPFAEKIEAVYVFPLPDNAAVNEFVMSIGQRRIRGIIREKQEAQRIYQEARSGGYVASLLTQERPNIFTQSVANIEPGKAIDIDIKYYSTLSFAGGSYEFVFPMVVGPRFNPPGSTDGIGAVGVGKRGESGQSTEIQYLHPDQRSGHDISLAVNLDAGMPVEEIHCRSHKVSVNRTSPRQAVVNLEQGDNIPNRDFVLRYKVAGDTSKAGMVAHKDDKGGYFTLMLMPPQNMDSLPRKPLEMVFTLDVSGSMSGRPIEQAKSAMRYALTHMNRDDTFQIVRFADNAEQMSSSPLPVTRENLGRGIQYMNNTSAGGGTMMLEGIRASLNFPHDESRLRFVAFLTDGYIGNETQILGDLQRSLGPARVFSFGVGSSTNRYLLNQMAKLGRGAAAYLSLQDDANGVMADYFDRISHPALTDISIDWGGMEVSEVYPRQVPDLFVGRPVILTGRFHGTMPPEVRITGKLGNEQQVMKIALDPNDTPNGARALPAVWARAKISDLADHAAIEPNSELGEQVRQVALEYGLMSPMTAFVAVDSLTKTAGDHGVTVAVPVPVPEGVRYETAVQE